MTHVVVNVLLLLVSLRRNDFSPVRQSVGGARRFGAILMQRDLIMSAKMADAKLYTAQYTIRHIDLACMVHVMVVRLSQ